MTNNHIATLCILFGVVSGVLGIAAANEGSGITTLIPAYVVSLTALFVIGFAAIKSN